MMLWNISKFYRIINARAGERGEERKRENDRTKNGTHFLSYYKYKVLMVKIIGFYYLCFDGWKRKKTRATKTEDRDTWSKQRRIGSERAGKKLLTAMWKGVKSKQCEPKICAANEWDFHIRSNTLVRSKKKWTMRWRCQYRKMMKNGQNYTISDGKKIRINSIEPKLNLNLVHVRTFEFLQIVRPFWCVNF